MKAITAYTNEETEAMAKKWHELRDKASSLKLSWMTCVVRKE